MRRKADHVDYAEIKADVEETTDSDSIVVTLSVIIPATADENTVERVLRAVGLRCAGRCCRGGVE